MKTTQSNGIGEAIQTAYASLMQFQLPMRNTLESYWRNQDQLLANMEDFARGWFARRHEAARTAQSSACIMCEAKSPVEAIQIWQAWMAGSVERMAADVLGVQRLLMDTADATAPPAKSFDESRRDVPVESSEARSRAA